MFARGPLSVAEMQEHADLTIDYARLGDYGRLGPHPLRGRDVHGGHGWRHCGRQTARKFEFSLLHQAVQFELSQSLAHCGRKLPLLPKCGLRSLLG